MPETKPGKGVYLVSHCRDPQCGTISVALIDADIREVAEVDGGLAPVIDIDPDQALEMAANLIQMARARITQEGE